jgi:hypothetical protein
MTEVKISTGIIDTRLQQSTPTTAFGSATKLGTDTGTNAGVQTLLRFDNAVLFGNGPGQIPLGATITSATLTLQTTNGSSQGGSLHRMLTGWDSQSTWDSLGNGIDFNDTDAKASADLVTGAVTTGSRTFTSANITATLQAWQADPTKNFGWGFKAGGTDGWDFYSSEGTVKPLLTVTYETGTTPPPTPPVVSIQDATAREDAGTMSFTVSLTEVAGAGGVTVNYATMNGTASSPGDFTGVSNGTLTFAQGETQKTIAIALTDDNVQESIESFSLNLTSATGATLSSTNKTATGTITDNDGTSPPPPIQASVVAIHNAFQFPDGGTQGYGNADPSGIAYVPGLDMLFVADSEHDETPFNSPTNLFGIRLDGTFVEAFSLSSFSKEPTGLAYNPNNGLLYISDDDAKKIFWVDPENPSVKLGEFDVRKFGSTDAEDPKVDPVTGHLFMLDGFSRKLFEFTDQGNLVSSMTLPSVMTDAEALAYDPRHDVFFIGSGATRGTIFEMDRGGNVLATIDLLNATSFRNPETGGKPKIKGLELAPSSDPHDGDKMNLYVADYGVDQNNDGRVFEVDLGAGWLIA